MKRIILFLAAASLIWMLSACNAQVQIAKNEKGLYGLKSGSKWIAEPVYTRLIAWECDAGKFFIAEKIPGTQKYYHVIFDNHGKMIKECNIYFYAGKKLLSLITPDGPTSGLRLDNMVEIFRDESCSYVYDDVFLDADQVK